LNFTKKFYETRKEKMDFYDKEKGMDTSKIEWYDENSFYVVSYMNGKPIKLRLDVRMVPGDFANSNPLG
jgi:hypothetical protein